MIEMEEGRTSLPTKDKKVRTNGLRQSGVGLLPSSLSYAKPNHMVKEQEDQSVSHITLRNPPDFPVSEKVAVRLRNSSDSETGASCYSDFNVRETGVGRA